MIYVKREKKERESPPGPCWCQEHLEEARTTLNPLQLVYFGGFVSVRGLVCEDTIKRAESTCPRSRGHG
jgi:hypothetical protein